MGRRSQPTPPGARGTLPSKSRREIVRPAFRISPLAPGARRPPSAATIGARVTSLPIDPVLPEALAALERARSLVLTAAPGAGKTTRFPRALLLSGACGDQEIVVLEPRRIAARFAARRVAEELSERPGERVGWQVRFEEVASPTTRLRFVTEGLLVRRLLVNPALTGVAAVVLDECHERNLQTDLALALLRRLQRGARPDLRIVAMSATLDPAPLSAFLGGAPVIEAPGRLFPVRIEHAPLLDPRPLEARVASAVRRLVATEAEGDILVFLPGAAEIRRAAEALAPLAAERGLSILPLHGSLSPQEQDCAVRPAARRKVILATNVAESSITIDGVAAVVDSGLARIPGHSPWSGLPSLRVAKVSRASAAQRAGRAGRMRPGACVRLYPRYDHDGRPAFETPEILRADLAEPVLALLGAGVTDIPALDWLDRPPPEALLAARELLGRLGALAPDGTLSAVGRRLLAFPLHPRLGRLVVEAERQGVPAGGCDLAAILSERDVRHDAALARSGPSDPLEALEAARDQHGPWEQTGRALRRLCTPGQERLSPTQIDQGLQKALLAAFPDRVARRRRPREPDLLLCGGGAATLARESVVRDADLVVAVEAEERGEGKGTLIRSASAIEPDWLLDLFPEALREEEEVVWNAEAERVDVTWRIAYGQIAIEESPAGRSDPEKVAAVLAAAALAEGPRAFGPPEALLALAGRVAFARERDPMAGFPALSDEEQRAALVDLCRGRRSFAELRGASLAAALSAALTPTQHARLAEIAPEHVTLPSGRRAAIEYAPGRPPSVASRLQDFFGVARGPTVDRGRVPLVLHLLAPNRRAVQVTSDLASFWARTYPAVRRELSRRYPRHAWPEDPTAVPPRRR